MTRAFDPTDVPTVTLAEMWLVMRCAIEAERGLVLVRGATADDIRTIEAAFWRGWRGDTARGAAILLRFWRLAEAFAGRRLKDRLMADGFAGLEPALAAAAGLRLNAGWGFAPQRLVWARARHGRPTAATSRRTHAPMAEAQLAA
jgi:hypothetical protein